MDLERIKKAKWARLDRRNQRKGPFEPDTSNFKKFKSGSQSQGGGTQRRGHKLQWLLRLDLWLLLRGMELKNLLDRFVATVISLIQANVGGKWVHFFFIGQLSNVRMIVLGSILIREAIVSQGCLSSKEMLSLEKAVHKSSISISQ